MDKVQSPKPIALILYVSTTISFILKMTAKKQLKNHLIKTMIYS